MSSKEENKPLARTESSTSYHDEDFLKPATLSSNVNKWLLQMREGKAEINYAELAGGEAGASIQLGKTKSSNLTDLVDTQVQTDEIQANVTNPVEDPSSTQPPCSHATTSAHSGVPKMFSGSTLQKLMEEKAEFIDSHIDIKWALKDFTLYKEFLQFTFATLDHTKYKSNNQIRYLTVDIFFRYMANVMNELSLETTKYMIIIHGLLCVYHSINIASKYVTGESVFPLSHISMYALRDLKLVVTLEEMQELELQVFEAVNFRLHKPTLHTYLNALIPLTSLKGKVTEENFNRNISVIMDFVFMNIKDVLCKYYEITQEPVDEELSLLIDENAVIIAGGCLYAVTLKFYNESSLSSSTDNILTEISNLILLDRFNIKSFSDAILNVYALANI